MSRPSASIDSTYKSWGDDWCDENATNTGLLITDKTDQRPPTPHKSSIAGPLGKHLCKQNNSNYTERQEEVRKVS